MGAKEHTDRQEQKERRYTVFISDLVCKNGDEEKERQDKKDQFNLHSC